ncbi:hypothetical protein [Marinibacterium sp. SX1]|uniref:hypothetical protein n=1 Tax=Marinibacterium sp. SX1 TaxID=3388424 RepID=UPI003D16F1B0
MDDLITATLRAACTRAAPLMLILTLVLAGATGARAQGWTFDLTDGVWASGETETEGPVRGLEEPEMDLSLGFALNDQTALTFDWRQLDADLAGGDFIGDISRRVPIIGLSFKF